MTDHRVRVRMHTIAASPDGCIDSGAEASVTPDQARAFCAGKFASLVRGSYETAAAPVAIEQAAKPRPKRKAK